MKQLVLTYFIADHSEVGIKRMNIYHTSTTGGECETTVLTAFIADHSEVGIKRMNMIPYKYMWRM